MTKILDLYKEDFSEKVWIREICEVLDVDKDSKILKIEVSNVVVVE